MPNTAIARIHHRILHRGPIMVAANTRDHTVGTTVAVPAAAPTRADTIKIQEQTTNTGSTNREDLRMRGASKRACLGLRHARRP